MTQAKEELEKLLSATEEYRKRNGLDSVMISAVSRGNGHAYAYRVNERVDAAIGAWTKNDSLKAATSRESRK